MRQKLFISHANPEDNQFAIWLYFKLTGMGYDVWCELKTLRKGEYFWDKIEDLIRNDTIKFLFVASQASATKPGGMSDEFEFARTIAREENLERFIHVLKIDDTPANARIGQHRINHIDFSQSWSQGLGSLLKELKEDNIPTNNQGFDAVNLQWRSLVQELNFLVQKEEIYSSNRFPILKMPPILYAHAFEELIDNKVPFWEYPYPVTFYSGYTVTFAACHDFEIKFPQVISYQERNSIEIPIEEVLHDNYETSFISNTDAKNKITFLLKKAINSYFEEAGLRRYKMSSKKAAYWYQMNSLEKDKAGGILMVGKQKSLNWHFAISATSLLSPQAAYSLSSHIVFTEDGKKLVPSDSRQHSARRKQGKQWWNKHWREKLTGFLTPLLDNDGNLQIKVGEWKNVVMSGESMNFISPVSYKDPKIGYIDEGNEDNYLNDDDDYDDEEID